MVLSDISFHINEGEHIALIGESGSGKTTLAKLLLRLEKTTSGMIEWQGKPLSNWKDRALYAQIQYVFQDAASALHPTMTVQQMLAEPIKHFHTAHTVAQLIRRVGLDESYLLRRAHELSGGQKQRICIARAIATNPSLLILDESLASLDKAAQQGLIALLKELQQEQNITYVMITHDLALAKELCGKAIVMYQGMLVDTLTDWVLQSDAHPYTTALLSNHF